MHESIVTAPRIEQYLDICNLQGEALDARLMNPVLVLELTTEVLQRAVGFRTTALDSDSVQALWQHVAALRAQGKRMRTDGLVRFVFAVAKKPESPFASRVTVGRTQSTDICIPDERVSKLHAYFEREDNGTYYIIDRGSRNSTRRNERALTPHHREPVSSCDRIGFGPFVTTFFQAREFQQYVSNLVESVSQMS